MADENEGGNKMKKTETLEEWLAKGNKIKVVGFDYKTKRTWQGRFVSYTQKKGKKK